MEKVIGFGGFFFRAADPTALAPFEKIKSYFGNTEKQVMLNFRVRDLEAMIVQLESAGIDMRRGPPTYPNGRFAWLNDPEGNPIELQEPA